MSSEAGISRVFDRLRPLCVTLTREHDVKHVSTLHSALKTLTNHELLELQEYVIFPLFYILKQSPSKSSDLYAAVCDCLGYILSRTPVLDFSVWMDILTTLCVLLNAPDGSSRVVNQSEQLNIDGLKCLEILIKYTPYDVISPLYSAKYLPPLGHAVSLLLGFSQNEASREIRLGALKCLMELTHCTTELTDAQRIGHGDTFASFLPGIAMATSRIVTGDVKQGQAVTSRALKLMSHVVSLVLGDADLATVQSNSSGQNDVANITDENLKKLVITRNVEWVNGTTEKLKILFNRMFTVKTHSNAKVRLTLVQWCNTLLDKCFMSLTKCVPGILEVLVGLVSDDYSNVSSAAHAAVSGYKTRHQSLGEKTLREVLEDNVIQLVTQLPRLIRTSSESDILWNMSLLCGYINLLGRDITVIWLSPIHLQRTVRAMLEVLTLDCSQVKVIAERSHEVTAQINYSVTHSERPRKHFKYFVDEKVWQATQNVLRLIGYHSDIDLILDHLLDLYNQSDTYRIQLALCINEILMGAAGKGVESKHNPLPADPTNDDAKMPNITTCSLKSLIDMVLEVYLSTENWNLFTSTESDDIVPVNAISCSVELLNRNILQVCTQLEGIGYFAVILGETFQTNLIEVMYALLEKLGSPTALVNQSASWALLEVARAMRYDDTVAVIRHNADYLVTSLAIRLRQSSEHVVASRVLAVMLRHCDADILAPVRHTVMEMLACLDAEYADNAACYLRVLHQLVLAFTRWYPRRDRPQDPVSAARQMGELPVVEFIREYHRQKVRAEDVYAGVEDLEEDEKKEEEDQKAGEDHYPGEEEEKPPLPEFVKLTEEVMVRCSHLMAASDPRVRLLVLRILAVSCRGLASYEDTLLPLIHKVWPPFVRRLHDEEKLVVIEAVETLVVITESSGDFVRQRIVKDVLTFLASFLENQAIISAKAGPAYKFTVPFKLQSNILRHIGPICYHANITGSKVADIIHACALYLGALQPAPLQELAVAAIEKFAEKDGDSVWLILNCLYPTVPDPPHPSLPTIATGSRQRNEFTDNVVKIMSSSFTS